MKLSWLSMLLAALTLFTPASADDSWVMQHADVIKAVHNFCRTKVLEPELEFHNDGDCKLLAPHLQRRRLHPSLIHQKASLYALIYAKDVLQKPWPAGEALLLQQPHYANLYARHVLKKPWPELETLLSKQQAATAAAYYSRHVNPAFRQKVLTLTQQKLHKLPKMIHARRWLAVALHYGPLPKAIADAQFADNQLGVWYAACVLNGRYPPLEQHFAEVMKHYQPVPKSEELFAALDDAPENPALESIALYARYVIGGPYKQYEDQLRDTPHWRDYEKHAISGQPLALRDGRLLCPLPQLEDKIAKSPQQVWYYGKHTQARFPKGEAILLQQPMIGFAYVQQVIEARWPELESTLYNHQGDAHTAATAFRYAVDYARQRIPAKQEKRLLAQAHPVHVSVVKYVATHKISTPRIAQALKTKCHKDIEDLIKARTRRANASLHPYSTCNDYGLYLASLAVTLSKAEEQHLLHAPKAAARYATHKGQWPALEKILLNSKGTLDGAYYYAIHVKKSRWPELDRIAEQGGFRRLNKTEARQYYDLYSDLNWAQIEERLDSITRRR